MAKRANDQTPKRPGPARKTGRKATDAPDGVTDAVRAEIVTRLAMFDSVADIHKDLVARGIDVSYQAVSHYNLGNARPLAQKWVELFHLTRANFLAEIAAEPISYRAYRMRQLGKIHELEMKRGNTTGARAALEQAAKEIGNIYTNVTKVQGTSIAETAQALAHTPDELRNMLADRLGDALERMKGQKPATPTQH